MIVGGGAVPTARRPLAGPGLETRANGELRTEAPDETVRTTMDRGDPRFGLAAPNVQQSTTRFPSGLTTTLSGNRSATPEDPLSLVDYHAIVGRFRARSVMGSHAYERAGGERPDCRSECGR